MSLSLACCRLNMFLLGFAGESREAPPRYVPEPGEEELQWSVHRNTRPATAHDASEMYQKAVDWKRRSAARWGLLRAQHAPRRRAQWSWL